MSKFSSLLDRIMKGDYQDASSEQKEADLAEIKKVCSIAAAAVSFQPIPLVDSALIAPIQIGMVQAIARIHGHKLDRQSILEMLSTFGASILAQNAMMAAAKLIPIAGWLISVSMAYALTWAIAEVSDHYFRTGRGASSAELKDMFKRVYKSKKQEKQAEHKGNATLKDKLDQLKQARAEGLINDEEFEKKKEDVLAGF
ncbi:MAG: DUF697 domain-containing protein [Pseudomonadota bacterium]